MQSTILSMIIQDNLLNGADSYFAKITDTVGVKFFKSKLMRDRNYDRHKRFAAIAPKVGTLIDGEIANQQMYGFFVEVVKTSYEISDWDVPTELDDLIRENNFDRNQLRDLHSENIGRAKGGRPVILDFSRCIDPDGFSYHNLYGMVKCYINHEYHEAVIENDTWKPVYRHREV